MDQNLGSRVVVMLGMHTLGSISYTNRSERIKRSAHKSSHLEFEYIDPRENQTAQLPLGLLAIAVVEVEPANWAAASRAGTSAARLLVDGWWIMINEHN